MGMTVNSIMFIIFQCTSKKKLQALIGQWQKKAFGKPNSQIKRQKLPLWSVCSFLKYRNVSLISPSPIFCRHIDL